MAVAFWRAPGDAFRTPCSLYTPASPQDTTMAEKMPPATPADEAGAEGEANNESPSSSSPEASTSFSRCAGAAASATESESVPSTSSQGEHPARPLLVPLPRPLPLPLPDPMDEDDFADRMEFNNNNGNAPNYMWLEENNNSALIDLNAVQPQRRPDADPRRPDPDHADL